MKKDNAIMHNRYIVLEDMEEEEEKERRECEEDIKSYCEGKLRNVKKKMESNMSTVDIIKEIRKKQESVNKEDHGN